ncbi:TetR/AcrR family transcriptional regulator [Gordonia crocea]|uniref:HTH tetR-type domain-containing protein n=1 Tax=Gordonia crocea TaxID=589162 RepID=A0A7I9UUM9_9ACTN|nr:TetR family transcriptional regulator [Gordonia crocea]GED96864.1 hypothetical protein nbrc107697_09030 [Gordonia crocea]
MPRQDRRSLIADAAIGLAAAGGNHAVTHHGVDRELGLPKGSSSYYFRTREALVGAAAARLVERSREEFARVSTGVDGVLDVITDYLADLVGNRRREVLARQALLLDPTVSGPTRQLLVGCLFSADAARDLMAGRGSPDPDGDSRRLLAVLEGIAFAGVHGSVDATADTRELVARAFPALR